MRKTMWLVIAGVALAFIGASVALYYAMTLRKEVDEAEAQVDHIKHMAEIAQTLNDRENEKTSEVSEGSQSETESRP